MVNPVALYLRISNDPMGLRAGVERQRKDCETLAATRFPGHPVVVYMDNDTSAYTGKVRREFRALVANISVGTVHALIAYNFDRLFRLPRELESFIDLCDLHKFRNVITAQGDIDLSTHDGQLHARILAAVAKKSSDDTSRRVKNSAADRLSRGLWPGGVPFGFTRTTGSDIAQDPTAVAVLRTAIDRIRAGASMGSLERDVSPLHPAAPTTRAGWRNTLNSPALSGLNSKGMVGSWEPILTPQQHADLRVLITHKQNSLKGATRAHWLSGLLVCGLCNGLLRVHTDRRRADLAYVCASCHKLSVSKLHTETVVSEWLFDLTPETIPTPAPRDAQRRKAQARFDEIAALYVAGDVPQSVFLAAKRKVEELHPTPHTGRAPHTSAIPLRDQWKDPSHTAAQKFAVGSWHLDRVIVAPGTGRVFDPKRLTPVWVR